MHPINESFHRLAFGDSYERWAKKSRTSMKAQNEELLARMSTRLGSPTLLGFDESGMPAVASREERRTHLDVFGGSGQGKSKAFELLVRNDVGRYGACVIDPSENGATVKDILNYCCHVGYEKVVYIDPHDFARFAKIPIFNPLKYNTPVEDNVGNVVDALGILWASSFSDRLGFLNLATSLLNILQRTRHTLPDSAYFLDSAYVRQRKLILDTKLKGGPIPLSDPHLVTVLKTKSGMAYEAIANRFSYFYKDRSLRMMLGSKKTGMNFKQLIRDKYLILVNLDPQGVWGAGQNEQRLLGTLIINEITAAIHSLREEGWNDPYYLYIDEVGDYSTPKIAYILDKKRKTGLSFTVAHQRFDQLSDRNVLSAIRGMANKIMFQTMMQDDRATMIRDMGYEEQARMIHELRSLRVQQAVVSIGKAKPRIVDFESVKSYPQRPEVIRDYKFKIYRQLFYRRPKDINSEINARFRNTATINPLEQLGGAHGRRTQAADSRVVGGAALFNRGADGERGQQPKKRRPVKTAYSEEE